MLILLCTFNHVHVVYMYMYYVQCTNVHVCVCRMMYNAYESINTLICVGVCTFRVLLDSYANQFLPAPTHSPLPAHPNLAPWPRNVHPQASHLRLHPSKLPQNWQMSSTTMPSPKQCSRQNRYWSKRILMGWK